MLSLTVFWINALVRSYSLYRILATIYFFLYLVCMSVITFSFIDIYNFFFFLVFKVLFFCNPVLVDRSKSPIKYANLCTEENRAKKGNNLQYIHPLMYLYIYLYIYIQTFASFSFCFSNLHFLLFFFFHVNLQLEVWSKWGWGTRHSSSHGCRASALPPPPDMKTLVKDMGSNKWRGKEQTV